MLCWRDRGFSWRPAWEWDTRSLYAGRLKKNMCPKKGLTPCLLLMLCCCSAPAGQHDRSVRRKDNEKVSLLRRRNSRCGYKVQILRGVPGGRWPHILCRGKDSLVFWKILYYHCILLRGASGAAFDLVAPTNEAGMEDRTHDRNPHFYLDSVPYHHGIPSYSQGVLQDPWGNVI